MAVGTRMQQRRAIESVWAASSYILADGELGVAKDTGIIKIGDGVNTWSSLDPAFDSHYLPILGTAANSDLLGGISAASFVKVADTSVTATNDTYVKRTSDGGVKGTDATEATELTSLQQMNAAVLASTQLQSARTVTAAATLALTDAGKVVFVNHASLTAQVMITVPTFASVAFPLGTVIEITAFGAGGAKIIPAAGGVVLLAGSLNAMPGWGTIRLVKVDTNSWYGVNISDGKRFPKIRLVKTAATLFIGAAGFPLVPYQSIDTNETYNPDDEWFGIPASGLAASRRVICKKEGEYLFEMNFIPTSGTTTMIAIIKMINDNTLTGSTILANGAATGTGSISKRVRLAAGETVGTGWSPGPDRTDQADGTSSVRSDFSITRLSD